jgi:class 3 adenylate cyclase/tetratricopeptide (TPR) repeat protein
MFCDQVNSVGRSERLDPEEFREVTRQYQETCEKIIQTFGGSIGQYQGDGLLVYFGYPLAHEDDAQRAVRAGLGILAELPHLNSRLQQTLKDLRDFPLQLRIGIHTGLAVVGEMGTGTRRELIALGEAPNIASRLQSAAEPNTVFVSADMHHLTRRFFEYHDLGMREVKGLSQPLHLYRVLQAHSHFEISPKVGVPPLVGRKEELELLETRWEQIKEGEGWVVLLSGEAGIGKSRLVQALKERLDKESHLRLELQCSPYHQNSAFYPVIDLLQRLLHFERTDTPQEKFAKLEASLERFQLSLLEVVPLLSSLLSLPLPAHYPALTLAPQRQRQKLQEALQALFVADTAQHPVLQIVEDLHWADPSTLEMFSSFVNQGSMPRSLTLFTFRSEFSPPWANRSHVTHLTLNRLSRKQTEDMMVQLAKGKTLPSEVTHQLVTKTDGVPLFVEELTKTVLTSDWLKEETNRYILTRPLPAFGIPATLHDLLLAKLDRLGPAKEVVQLGATLGREFPYELLQAVSSLDEAALQSALNQLVTAELLYRRKFLSYESYVFKHALFQEAAYQSLLRSTRQQSHRKIAQALQEEFADIAETQPELLADHYTEAGLIEQAIPCWQRAGQRAVERSANLEAANHFYKGLELLKRLPETPARAQQELMLQLLLGGPLMATKGYGAPEVENVYTRARALCRQMAETPLLFSVLFGLWAFFEVRAEHKIGYELGEQLLDLAHRQQDPLRFLEAHNALGATLFYVGELNPALEHLKQGMTFYDPQQHNSLIWPGGHPAVQCLSYEIWTLWLLGYPDQALKKSQAGLVLAQELSHPFSLAFALTFAAQLHRFRREVQATQERAEETVALSIEQEFPLPLAVATIHRGWALEEQGQEGEEVTQTRQGLAVWRATGAELFLWPYLLAALAEGYEKEGRPEEGLTVLAEALAIVDKTGERFWEAELYRLKGQLTLETSGWRLETSSPSLQATSLEIPVSQEVALEAEGCFHKAIEIAQRQGAKSLELRAGVSLSRLWRQQNKKAEARQLLAEIYDWFTEGLDTADLREAKVLLEQIS